jgi:hypothetical protein
MSFTAVLVVYQLVRGLAFCRAFFAEAVLLILIYI